MEIFKINKKNELYVSKNKLLNRKNKEVRLQGVNIPSLEWLVNGDHIVQSFRVALDEWKANVIRLPLSSDFWFGEGGDEGKKFNEQSDGGESYRKLVDKLIGMVSKRKKYIILDLHRVLAPDKKCLKFWNNVAERYKNHPLVLFGIFNEAYGISWDVWKNGGEAKKKKETGQNNKKSEQYETYFSPGHQALVDEIRAQGANNIIIAGGLDWGYDLSGINEGYSLEDSNRGNGIIYDSHVYPWKSDWDKCVSVIEDDYPILIGECGFWHKDNRPDDFHWEESGPEDHYSIWVPKFMKWLEEHKFNWTAWSFHTGACPRLLKDWDYTPSIHWGKVVKEKLKNI